MNLPRLKTSCETCVFAQFENDQQTGCDIGRLDIFKKQNRAEYGENSYIIDGVCNTCRGTQWANKYLGYNLLAQAEKEVQISIDFIILISDISEKIYKELPEIVNQCCNQKKILPKNIICVVKNFDLDYQKLYDELNYLIPTEKIQSHLVRVLEENADISRMLDMGVKKCKSSYFAVFDLNDNIPINLINVLNTKLNYELIKISMIEPYKNFSGLILQTSLYRLYDKNKEDFIYNKIKQVSKEQNLNQTFTWDQLWNRQPLHS